MNQKKSDGKKRPSASFVTGAIALAFLITGYQTALFVHRAAALKVVSDMTSPDTVFVYADGEAFAGGKSGSGDIVSGRNSVRASRGYSGDKTGNRDMVKSGGNPTRVSGGYSSGDSWDQAPGVDGLIQGAVQEGLRCLAPMEVRRTRIDVNNPGQMSRRTTAMKSAKGNILKLQRSWLPLILHALTSPLDLTLIQCLLVTCADSAFL